MTDQERDLNKKKVEFLLSRLELNLNENQKELLMPSTEVKICTAGAGAGKTTTIVASSVAEEVINQVPASKITCITFTRKAAQEFRKRHQSFMKKIGSTVASDIKISTIHAMCRRYVEMFKDSLGMNSFEIISDQDLQEITRKVISAVTGAKLESVTPNQVQDVIAVVYLMINKMALTEEEVTKSIEFINLGMEYSQFKEIREIIINTQRRNGRVHIETCQILFHELLEKDLEFRREIQNRIQSLFVDEFQDTSKLQLAIINYLKSVKCSLTVVGDPDQSIYRWRGACDAFPLTMAKYPTHKLIKLDTNYRSPDFVIDCSNALIRNNKGRIVNTIKGTGKKGKLEIIPITSNQQASRVIGDMIVKDYHDSGKSLYSLIEKLVLYRNHSQAMFLAYDLASKDIPVVITENKVLPHNDKIFKDILGIVNWLDNPNDGKLTSEYLFKVSSQIRKPKDKSLCPFYNSDGRTHFKDIPVHVGKPDIYMQELSALMQISKMIREKLPHREIFSRVLSLYMDNYYRKYRINLYMGKTEEDVNAIERFILSGFEERYDIAAVRYVLTKVESFVLQKKEDGLGVRLFSIHNAKGLEADEVYLLDMNGTVQPNPNVIDTLVTNKSHREVLDYLSEERSLAFVAITRCKRDLYVTYQVDNPSPFNLESGLNRDLRISKDVIKLEERTLKSLWVQGQSYGLAHPPQQLEQPNYIKEQVDRAMTHKENFTPTQEQLNQMNALTGQAMHVPNVDQSTIPAQPKQVDDQQRVVAQQTRGFEL